MAEKSAEASPSVGSTPSFEGSSGNWWESWISSAKTKSAEVYSMVKKDLDEIGSAVKSEASHVLNTTSNVIGKTLKLDVPESPANVMKKSISSFIGQVSTALSPELDDDDDTEVILSSGDTTMLSTYKKELEALQRVDATFIVPAYSPEFDAWKASLELTDAGVISPTVAIRRLDTSPVLRAQYEKLVPDAVSHEDFWERYLFRVALLQDRLAAAARKQPATQPSNDPVLAHLPPLQSSSPPASPVPSPKKTLIPIVDKEQNEIEQNLHDDAVTEVGWDEDDFALDLELTEEQQTLLLQEYEKEIASKKKRDVTNNNATQKTNINEKKIKKSTNINEKEKNSPKKTDVCGNNLVEDYFGDEKVKDDASSKSDESWEKEFEVDDVEKA